METDLKIYTMNRSIAYCLTVLYVVTAASCRPAEDERFDLPVQGQTVFTADFTAMTIGQDETFWKWDSGDEIGVFGSSEGTNERYVLKKSGYGVSEAEFYGPEVSGEQIFAYYPYLKDFALSDGKMVFELLSRQIWSRETSVAEQFRNQVTRAFAFLEDNDRLTFGYPQGVLAMELKFIEPSIVKSIILSSETINLAGIGYVSEGFHAEMDQMNLYPIVLDCPDGVQSETDGKLTQFPIVMTAGKYTDLKLRVEVEGKPAYTCHLPAFEISYSKSECLDVKTIELKIDGMTFGVISGGDLE